MNLINLVDENGKFVGVSNRLDGLGKGLISVKMAPPNTYPDYTGSQMVQWRYDFEISEWIADGVSCPAISQRQFHYLLAEFKYKQIVDQMLTALEKGEDPLYSTLYADIYGASFYNFDKTLMMLNSPGVSAALAASDIVISHDDLRAQWLIASKF